MDNFFQLLIKISALVVVGTPIVGSIVWFIRRRRKLFDDYNAVWKRSWFLRPTNIMGLRASKRMGFEKYYFKREQDERIREGIREGKNILIVGSPLSGKTRSVYEAFKRAGWRHFITVPNIEEPEKREYRFPLFFDAFLGIGRRRYLFLDDIDKYATSDKITSLLRKFSEKKCSFIATCRSGVELEKFEQTELGYVYKEPIEILRIYEEQENHLREEIPKATTKEIPTHFDHTIGSIFLALEAMKQRYDGLDNDHEKVLLSIKRLFLLGVYRGLNVFPTDWIKIICREKYHIDLQSDEYTCEKILKELDGNNFIRLQKPNVRVEEAYLEHVIKDVDTQPDDFREALILFRDDSEALYYLGIRAIDLGEVSIDKETYMTIAVNAFKIVLETWTKGEKYARAKTNVGRAYLRLSEVREKRNNLDMSVRCSTDALEFFTKDHFPLEYAIAHNNLGIAYEAISDIEDKKNNIQKAIMMYKEALAVFKSDKYPIYYAMTKINLGNTYQRLSDIRGSNIEDKRKDLCQAIQSYEAALSIYLPNRFPIQYASIQNNLGINHEKMSYIEDSENSINRAIKAYKEALNIYRSKQFPAKYAMTLINLGGAYQRLYEIDDKKENLSRAIKSYEKVLIVYTKERFPINFALTMENLGIVYGLIARLEDREENCRKARECCHEALKILTKKDYPLNYQKLLRNMERLDGICSGEQADVDEA